MESTVRTTDKDVLEKLANLKEFDGDMALLDGSLTAENLKTAKVTLTVAEIKALNASPKELIAAPGANKVLEFVGAMLRLVAGSEVLTETDDNVQIHYTDGSGVAVSDVVECTGWIDQATNAVTRAVPVKDAIVADESDCVNKALVLYNANDEFAGNASNDASLEIYITYRVHDLS